MWRFWDESPPQIPWAPVETWNPAVSHHPFGIISKRDMHQGFSVGNLLWRPTGIYREEFWQTTGEWL
jgi:hypothetical protein